MPTFYPSDSGGMPGPRVASGDHVSLRMLERDDLGFLQRVSTTPELRYTVGAPLRTYDEVEAFYGLLRQEWDDSN